MTRRARIAIFVPAWLGLAALLGWGLAGLPAFGHYRGRYGFLLDAIATPERHVTNVVMATTFDYRGVDTMGEEFILFAAVAGVVLLLRGGGRDEPRRDVGLVETSDAVRVVAGLMVGGAVLVGLWLVAFGYVTPGGGFQGGVAVAAGAALLYLATGRRAFAPFGNEEALDPLEATGAGAYVVIGLAALVSGLPFLSNLLGPGTSGTLWAGGSVPLLNWAAGLEVAAANLVLYSEFLAEYVVPLPRRQA